MTADPPPTEHVLEGRHPSRREEFYCSFGYEITKSGLARIDAHLQRAVTISSSLLGGSVVFFKEIDIGPVWRGGMMALLLASLGAALHGAGCRVRGFDPDWPEDVRAAVTEVEGFRYRWWRASGLFLSAALAVGVVGSVRHAILAG